MVHVHMRGGRSSCIRQSLRPQVGCHPFVGTSWRLLETVPISFGSSSLRYPSILVPKISLERYSRTKQRGPDMSHDEIFQVCKVLVKKRSKHFKLLKCRTNSIPRKIINSKQNFLYKINCLIKVFDLLILNCLDLIKFT